MNNWWKPKDLPGTSGTGSVTGTGGVADVVTEKKSDPLKSDVPTNAIGSGLNMSATAKAGDVIAKLALEPQGGFTVVQQVTKFTNNGNKVVFRPGGTRLNGDAPAHGGAQSMLLEIPPQFRGMRLTSLSLTHSQVLDEKTGKWNGKKSGAPGGENDPTPGMSRVEFHVAGKGWTGLGQQNKFAEARQEVETLHDLPPAGGEIDAIRVKGAAVDPVHIHEVSLNFLPNKPATFDEAIFTNGMSFGDQWNGKAPNVYRDKSSTPHTAGTRYPGAVTLNGGSYSGWAETPEATIKAMAAKGWHADHDSIVIPLKAGDKLRSVEVLIGDTFPDAKTNNDGSYGKKGWATLDIEVETASGKRIPLLGNENVPPQGLLTGSTTGEYVVQPGDKVRVSVNADTAAVMGVRVGYN